MNVCLKQWLRIAKRMLCMWCIIEIIEYNWIARKRDRLRERNDRILSLYTLQIHYKKKRKKNKFETKKNCTMLHSFKWWAGASEFSSKMCDVRIHFSHHSLENFMFDFSVRYAHTFTNSNSHNYRKINNENCKFCRKEKRKLPKWFFFSLFNKK